MTYLSIRLRMALWITVAFAVILVSFGLAVYGLLRKTHYDQIDRSLRTHLRDLADRQPRDDEANAQHRLAELLDGARGCEAYLVDRNGRIFAHTADVTPADLAAAVVLGDAEQFDTAHLANQGHVRRLTVPLADTGRWIVLLAELKHVDEELWEVIRTLLITTPITLVAAASIAYLLAKKSLSPVDQLRQMTDEITAEHLDRRLPVGNASDELGLLAQTINSMIGRLERSFSEVRRFTADASHELRTPLAVIRSEAELGLAELTSGDRARRRLESIVEECQRLTELTTQLLTLCRQEAGLAQSIRAPVSLRITLAESAESVRSMAQAKQQTIATEARDDVAVWGDAARLHQVFTNLLHNAVKFTPPGGTITLSLGQSSGLAEVTVQDTGIGISPEDLPRVFDRFYQVNPGRSHAEGGAGLGLSIAQSIVEAHGGQIAVTSELGRGSAFRVVLPSACGDGKGEILRSESADASHADPARPN